MIMKISQFDSSKESLKISSHRRLKHASSSRLSSVGSSFVQIVIVLCHYFLLSAIETGASSSESQVVIQDSYTDSSFINHTLTSDLIRDGRCKHLIVSTLFWLNNGLQSWLIMINRWMTIIWPFFDPAFSSYTSLGRPSIYRPSIFHVVKFPNDECLDATNQSGVCYTALECKAFGGTGSTLCAKGYGTCCSSREIDPD